MLKSSRARQVLAETDQIVVDERRLILRLLANLHEIEQNKFYLELGYSSMFEYCTGHLRYSEPAAMRRIRSARCLSAHPELTGPMESGEVGLTTVAMISYHITSENASSLIEAIKNKSKREVEQVIAALDPLSAAPRDRVRPIMVPVNCAKSTSSGGGKKSSSDLPLMRHGTEAQLPTVSAEVQFERRARVEFTAHEDLMAKLDRIRALISHRMPVNAPLDELFQFMADYVLEREDPEARQQRREAREMKRGETATGAPAGDLAHGSSNSTATRSVPASVRDRVFVRDKRCSYVGPDGKRCGSTHVLQVDHVKPVARGGASTIDNLRLLCAYHNRMESERMMGKKLKRPRGG